MNGVSWATIVYLFNILTVVGPQSVTCFIRCIVTSGLFIFHNYLKGVMSSHWRVTSSLPIFTPSSPLRPSLPPPHALSEHADTPNTPSKITRIVIVFTLSGKLIEVFVTAKKSSETPKPKAFFHWVSAPLKCTSRLYDRL